MTGRDGKESDLENELLSRAVESLRKAQGYNDESKRIGQEIVALEEEIKLNGRKLSVLLLYYYPFQVWRSRVVSRQRIIPWTTTHSYPAYNSLDDVICLCFLLTVIIMRRQILHLRTIAAWMLYIERT